MDALGGREHDDWFLPDRPADPLHRHERQVALTPLQSTDVCAVEPEFVGEGFLRQTTADTVLPNIAPERPLKITLGHVLDVPSNDTQESTD